MFDLDLAAMRHSARRASDLMKALSNENRLLILCQLSQGERSVGELQAIIGLAQSALSQHLARLRHDDLVQTRRQSQTIYYSLKGEEARQVIAVLYRMYCAPLPDTSAQEPEAGARRALPTR